MKTKYHTSPVLASLIACGLLSGFALGNNGNGNGNTTTTSNGNGGGNTVGNAAATAAALIPAQPVGSLTTSSDTNYFREGTHPTLQWHILYPSSVSNMAVVNPPGSIEITSNNTYVSVQPIGTGTTDGSSVPTSQQYTEARISVNGSSYTQLFYGQTSDVTPQNSLYIKKHQAGDVLDFGGRYVQNNTWTPFYTTQSSNMQVVTLKNGDTIPTSFPLHTSPQLAGYLGPYLDGAGKVKVGPMSLLVLMELGSTNHNESSFDYQDMALLVTLSAAHPNNGHGNNLDGVDSSNPGRGRGGPTGLNNTGGDPSGGVDDERR